MARKGKGRKQPKAQQHDFGVADFIFPGEKVSYWGGVAGVAAIYAVLAAIGHAVFRDADGYRLWYVPVLILAWPVLAILICNLLASRDRVQQLRRVGRQAKVAANNHPELHRVLLRQAGLLGLSPAPEMYVVADDQPVIYCLPSGPGTVIASQALRERLSTEEVEALLARELTHIRCRHVRLELAMVFIRSSNVVLKVIFLPVLLMMLFARSWTDLIEFTADRGALLVTLKPAVVNSAIVKHAVVADPNAGITQEELEAFIRSSADIQTDAAQLERHFKVGQFISTQPNLRERIEQLTAFPHSPQGQQAVAKMARLQGVPPGAIALVKTGQAGGIEQVDDDELEDTIPAP